MGGIALNFKDFSLNRVHYLIADRIMTGRSRAHTTPLLLLPLRMSALSVRAEQANGRSPAIAAAYWSLLSTLPIAGHV